MLYMLVHLLSSGWVAWFSTTSFWVLLLLSIHLSFESFCNCTLTCASSMWTCFNSSFPHIITIYLPSGYQVEWSRIALSFKLGLRFITCSTYWPLCDQCLENDGLLTYMLLVVIKFKWENSICTTTPLSAKVHVSANNSDNGYTALEFCFSH